MGLRALGGDLLLLVLLLIGLLLLPGLCALGGDLLLLVLLLVGEVLPLEPFLELILLRTLSNTQYSTQKSQQ